MYIHLIWRYPIFWRDWNVYKTFKLFLLISTNLILNFTKHSIICLFIYLFIYFLWFLFHYYLQIVFTFLSILIWCNFSIQISKVNKYDIRDMFVELQLIDDISENWSALSFSVKKKLQRLCCDKEHCNRPSISTHIVDCNYPSLSRRLFYVGAIDRVFKVEVGFVSDSRN